MKKQGHASRQTGFTLIELLVSMGIVAVLTGMAAFNFNQSRVRARDIQRKNDLSQLQKALELYKNDNGILYPAQDGVLAAPQTILNDAGYTNKIFHDPRETEWQNYKYYTADQRTYYLMTCLENTADQTKTVDGNICKNFNTPTTDTKCTCGPSDKGIMYTISQP